MIFYIGFLVGYGVAFLEQWWIKKVAADFRRELEDRLP